MAKRKIIEINADKCNGCSQCIPNCPEGALQMIDGKARLVSDLFCDGLGACIGHCPQGAIKIEEREALPYEERKVMENIVKHGSNTIKAHLEHLKEHGENTYLSEAVKFLEEKGIENPVKESKEPLACGCPGAMAQTIKKSRDTGPAGRGQAELGQWPVQLMLVPENASYFKDADLLIAADCVPFAYPNFHQDFLKGKAIVVGCPKLDDIAFYKEKLVGIFKSNSLKSVTVAHMDVPCCFGLEQMIKEALGASGKEIKYEKKIVSIEGTIK